MQKDDCAGLFFLGSEAGAGAGIGLGLGVKRRRSGSGGGMMGSKGKQG